MVKLIFVLFFITQAYASSIWSEYIDERHPIIQKLTNLFFTVHTNESRILSFIQQGTPFAAYLTPEKQTIVNNFTKICLPTNDIKSVQRTDLFVECYENNLMGSLRREDVSSVARYLAKLANCSYSLTCHHSNV